MKQLLIRPNFDSYKSLGLNSIGLAIPIGVFAGACQKVVEMPGIGFLIFKSLFIVSWVLVVAAGGVSRSRYQLYVKLNRVDGVVIREKKICKTRIHVSCASSTFRLIEFVCGRMSHIRSSDGFVFGELLSYSQKRKVVSLLNNAPGSEKAPG